MVDLQSAFIMFHDAIKISDEDEILREKRDILLDKLKNNISEEACSFTHFNQGSYAMGTGIKPDNGDFDIDVGIRFNMSKDDYDPLEAKKWVRDALDGHTNSVVIRRPCVTVTYQRKGEDLYHVDFAVYAVNNLDGKSYIAKGKEYSSSENIFWEVSDPQKLIDTIREHFSDGDDREQFRRIIRYMKKWKSHVFSEEGHCAPTGIALTILAYNFFIPCYSQNYFERKYDDFKALYKFVNSIKDEFYIVYDDGEFYHSISANLPVEPYNNLFKDMTFRQQENFYNRICKLANTLEEVSLCEKIKDACEKLSKELGGEFPILNERSSVGTSESA